MNLSKLVSLILIIGLVSSQSGNKTVNPSLEKLIEVSPNALDVLLHAFDNIVIYFHQAQNEQELNATLEQYQVVKNSIKATFPDDHALFGYVNMTLDSQNILKRFGKKEGFLVLNKFLEPESFEFRNQIHEISKIYEDISHPKIPLAYSQQTVEKSELHYNLLFKFKELQTLNHYNKVYEKIKYYLEELNIGAFASPVQKDEKQYIKLFYFQKEISNYVFKNMTVKQIANQIVQELNIDSLPHVSELKQENLHRVFGGVVSDQLLFLYKPTISLQKLQEIENVLIDAAEFNKKEQLRYQRVIFCQTDVQFFEEQFNEESSKLFTQATQNENETDYALIFIKTDYDRFNLKKYIMKQTEKELSSEDVITFIEDVRMRKIEPQYKSEQAPSQQENKGVLRKIVGSTFINEIYEKKGQSTIVLFIDSKDKSSYREVKATVEEFASKYKQNFEGKLTFGIFDLAKNEHKLLYLKQAPQLILFDVTNKKHTKYFKLVDGISIEALQNWVNNEVSNVNIQKIEELL